MNTPDNAASAPSAAPAIVVLVATRKGAWLFHGDTRRQHWRVNGPHLLGHIISHLVLDPRDGRTLLAAAKTGHLGPTLYRSTDLGHSWEPWRRHAVVGHPYDACPLPDGRLLLVGSLAGWLLGSYGRRPGLRQLRRPAAALFLGLVLGLGLLAHVGKARRQLGRDGAGALPVQARAAAVALPVEPAVAAESHEEYVASEAAQELPTSEQLIRSETLVTAHSVPNSNGQFGDDLDLPEFFR